MRQVERNISIKPSINMHSSVEVNYSKDKKHQESPKKGLQRNVKAKNKRKTLLPQKASPQGVIYDILTEDSQESKSSQDEHSATQACDDHDGTSDSKTLHGELQVKSGIKCNMCEKLFQYKSEFDSHYWGTYKQKPVYTCSFCNKTMEKYSTFRSHCYRHITEGRFKCSYCSQGFSLQSLMQVHVLAKHTKEKPYTCDECGKSFITKPGLKIHAKKHQAEPKEDYPCVECGKILHTKSGLTSHMNVHRLGRRFMCDVCGKTFTQKVNMQQHVKQHTGDKPYECDKCGKSFAERSHLARHYSFHSDDRPFKCGVCNKMYKTERCLKVHRLVHGKDRPYVCTYCSKGFLSSTKLKQHYNIHTGERPYACKYCERRFTNFPNWLKHTRRRHNVDHKTGQNLSQSSNDSITIDPVNSTEDITIPRSEEAVKIEPDNFSGHSQFIDVDVLTMLPMPDLLPHLETADAIHHDHLTTDFKLSKTDELFLQQSILNFPITHDSQGGDSMELPDEEQLLPSLSSVIGGDAQQTPYDLVPLQMYFIQ